MRRLYLLSRLVVGGLGLLVVVGGAGLVLILLGPSPPATVPTADSLRETLSGPVEPDVVIGIVGILGWIAWLVLLRAVVVEVAAVVRGTAARQVSIGRGPQLLSRRILSWVLVGASSAGVAGSATVLAWDLPAGGLGLETAVPVAAVSDIASDEAGGVAEGSAERFHTVAPGDNLWDLAELYYGDGLAWRRIFDANRHRELGASALVDPNLIQPGWELSIPFEDGPSDHDRLEHRESEPDPPPAVWAPPGSGPGVIIRVDPGGSPASATEPPAVDSSESTEPTEPTTTSAQPARPTPGADGADPPVLAPQDPPESGGWVTEQAAPYVITALLGAGLVAAYERRRRLASSRRDPGDPVPGPGPLPGLVLPAEDLWSDGGAARVASVLRGVADLAGRAPSLSVTDEFLELLWPHDGPMLPSPWRRRDTGRWVAPRRVLDEAVPLADDVSGRAGVVTLGEDGGRVHLLDLAGAPLVSLEGPDVLLGPLVRSMALELENRPDPDELPDVLDLDEVDVDVAEAALTERLDSAGDPEELPLLVVLVGPGATPPDEDLLARVAAEGIERVSVVVSGGAEGGLRVVVDGRSVTVGSREWASPPAAVGEAALVTLSEPVEARDLGSDPLASSTDDSTDAWMEVRVLGQVDLGEMAAGLTPQQASIVTLLVVKGPSTASQIQDSVWGRNPPSVQRFKNVLAEIRAKLGLDRFPVALDGIYRLAPGVRCDLAEADDLLERYRLTGDEMAVELALALCRGAPFEMPDSWVRHFGWVDMDSILVRAEARLSDAAHKVATARLEVGDHDGAARIAELGLVVCPMSEALVRLAARGHRGAGRADEARALLEAHLHQLDELGLGEADPETEELFHSLTATAISAE